MAREADLDWKARNADRMVEKVLPFTTGRGSGLVVNLPIVVPDKGERVSYLMPDPFYP